MAINIISTLQHFSPHPISVNDIFVPFSVERITGSTNFRSDTIYVGYQSEVQGYIGSIQHAILFLIEDVENFSLPVNHSNEIVFFPQDVDIYRLMEDCRNVLRRQIILDRKSHTLLECINQTEDIAKVVDTVSELIQNPVIILDISYKVLGYSENYRVDDFQWQQNIKRGYCSFEYIGGFNRIEGVVNSPNTHEPFIVECFTSPLRRYISKMFLDGRQLGYIIAIEAVTPFSQIDTELMALISDSMARFVNSLNQQTQNINNRMYDSVFIDCIEGRFKSRDAFMERMSQTGMKTDSIYQLLSVDITSYNNFDPANEYLRHRLEELFPGCWIVCYNNNVVVLIDIHKDTFEIMPILKAEENMLSQYKLRIGISDTFTDLFKIPFHYHKAKSALALSNITLPNDRLALYNDYKVYDMMAAVLKSSHNPRDFLNSSAQKILQYDSKNNSDYFKTMSAYLHNGRRLDDTANELHVHKNTVSYRINKIRELFHVDFDDTDTEFNLCFSCKMAEMLKHNFLEL